VSLVLAAVACWSVLGAIGKTLYGLGAYPLAVVTFRVAFALAILLVALGAFRPRLVRIPPRRLPALVLYGLVAIGANFACFFYALRHTSVATAVVIVYSHPALVALLSWPLFGERLDRRKLLALGLTLGGVFLVAGAYAPEALRGNLVGVGLALGSAIAISVYNILGKKLLRGMNAWTVTLYGFAFGGIALTVLWATHGAQVPALPAYGWGLIFVLAVFPSILAYGLYLKALTRIEASRAAIVATLEPVLAAVWAWLALGETVTPLQLGGGALVLAGVASLRTRGVPVRFLCEPQGPRRPESG